MATRLKVGAKPAAAGWRRIYRWSHAVEELLFPPQCLQCGQAIRPSDRPAVCAPCLASWDDAATPRCPRCGSRRPQLATATCGRCARRLDFDRCFVLGSYAGSLRDAVLKLKRPGSDVLAMALADLMVTRWEQEIRSWRPDCVTSVPMHWRRRLIRGVNTPETIAEQLGRRLGLPTRRLLARCRPTRLQTGLSAAGRRRNLRGAFRCRRGSIPRRVLVVDDILTTGATCNEVAKVLKKSGVKLVAAVAIARTEELG